MKSKRVFSENAAFQMFEVLKTNRNKRYKHRAFLVEGVRNINHAIQYGWEIQSFLYAGETAPSGWARNLLQTVATEVNYELAPHLMEKISDKDETSELMAIVKMKDEHAKLRDLSASPILMLFDRPSNKGNLGTIIRSCDAFGTDGLIITGHAVDMYDPEVVRSSIGSFFRVPMYRMSDNAEIEQTISALKSQYPALKVIGTTAHRQASIFDVDLTGPVLLCVGNETKGLNRYLAEMSDVMATIPMSGDSSASSFNVSCAASILLYETVRQRTELHPT